MEKQKLRSRSYPVIDLKEAVELLAKLRSGAEKSLRDRDSIAQALGYSTRSGGAMRRIAALTHFGILDLRRGVYSPTLLADELLAQDELRRKAALRKACLNPSLFREILSLYDFAGKVPRQLALTLPQEHGIQSNVKDEVSQVFMTSATYAGILDSDGTFREEYYQETGRSRRREEPVMAPPAIAAPVSGPSQPDTEPPRAATNGLQVLRFFVTDQKEVEIRLPARLNEQDIRLLQAQINFLELQVQMNRPDQPVRFDVYRGDRQR